MRSDDLVWVTTLNESGLLRLASHDPVGAREYLEQAVTVLQAAYGPDDRRVAVALNNLALALLGMRDTQGAKLR